MLTQSWVRICNLMSVLALGSRTCSPDLARTLLFDQASDTFAFRSEMVVSIFLRREVWPPFVRTLSVSNVRRLWYVVAKLEKQGCQWSCTEILWMGTSLQLINTQFMDQYEFMTLIEDESLPWNLDLIEVESHTLYLKWMCCHRKKFHP